VFQKQKFTFFTILELEVSNQASFSFLLFFFAVVGIKPRVLSKLGKCSTTEPHHKPLKLLFLTALQMAVFPFFFPLNAK
jgi:hypothetical protein